MEIFTVGHSTRSAEEFLALLEAHGIEIVADIRRFPGSRRHPQFAREALAAALAEAGQGPCAQRGVGCIEYVWLPGLGGRRSRRKNSPHTAWRVPAFAGYADHMETPEFQDAVHELLALARRARTAILCAEALPHRCHRRLVSDWLVAHGVSVQHLLGPKRVEAHTLTPFARIDGDRLVYDGGQPALFEPEHPK